MNFEIVRATKVEMENSQNVLLHRVVPAVLDLLLLLLLSFSEFCFLNYILLYYLSSRNFLFDKIACSKMGIEK